MEPHFHKDYRIDERDLIPDNSIYEDFPESAEEGRRIVIDNGDGTFSFYQYVQGAWREIGQLPNTLLLLGETELLATNANVDVTFTPTNFLKVVFEMTANLSSANAIYMEFNGDTATNYITKVEINAGGFSEYPIDTKIYLNDGAYARQQVHIIEITNRQNYHKRVLSKGTVTNGQIAPIITVEAFANWNNTTDQISSIRITADGTKTFPIGTKISVYGIN